MRIPPAARPPRHYWLIAAFSVLMAAGSPSGAQTGVRAADNLGGVLQHPLQPRPTLPGFEQPTPTPGLGLAPVLPPSEEGIRVPGEVRVFAREFRTVGNTVFSAAELAEVTKPFTNREITFEDLESVRYALTLHYIQHGYINSGAIVPDQTVQDGVIIMQIIEGKLTDIEVEGTRWLRSRYIRDRLKPYGGPPLNVQRLQEGLQLLQANPLVGRINAELRPGFARGEAILKVRVEDTMPYHLGLAVNDYQSPSVGGERFDLDFADDNLSGNGDPLYFRYGVTAGVNDYDAGYTLPFTAGDTSLGFEFRRTDALVVEAPFDRLDITSTTDTYTFTLQQPVYRTLSEDLTAPLSVDYRRSETFLLGRPFTFSLGAHDGRSAVSVLRLSPEWVQRSPVQVLAARSRFSVGIHAFGATENSGPVPDGQFFAWLGQFQWARRLPIWGAEAVVRADIQLTPNRLLSLEQFTVGGNQSVRGYRENQLVRDNGAVGSVESRLPVLWNRQGQAIIQLAPFTDVGGAWATRGHTGDPAYLASVGVGVRWAMLRNANFQLYWGYALKHVDTPGGDPQDYGLHFQLSVDLGLPEQMAETLAPWRETRPTLPVTR